MQSMRFYLFSRFTMLLLIGLIPEQSLHMPLNLKFPPNKTVLSNCIHDPITGLIDVTWLHKAPSLVTWYPPTQWEDSILSRDLISSLSIRAIMLRCNFITLNTNYKARLGHMMLTKANYKAWIHHMIPATLSALWTFLVSRLSSQSWPTIPDLTANERLVL